MLPGRRYSSPDAFPRFRRFRRSHRLNADLPAHQLHICHGRVVAGAVAAFQDSQVAAGAVGEVRAEVVEQFADDFPLAEARERGTAIGDAGDFGQRNQRLGHAPQFLGFG